jgi:catechol-2,3-dioxygenase
VHLNRIVLPVVDVDEAADFYRTTLGLPVQPEAGVATVTVGSTRLDLRAAQGAAGPHHLAMTIPRNTFASARSWLEGRARLLNRDGEDEFEGPSTWNSRSLYFDGPEGAVLELIERRDLPPVRSSSFSSEELECVSEVGIAVPDVEQAVALLQRGAGIETYGDPPSHDFAAVGDVHGLLILVRPGRAWLPTADRYAAITPITVEAVGPPGTTCTLGADTVVHLTESGADRW